MRSKEYSVKDVILVLGKDAEAYDISDQICLAYGHTVFHGTQLLIAYGRSDVDAIYPLVHPGGLRDETTQIRDLLDKEIRFLSE